MDLLTTGLVLLGASVLSKSGSKSILTSLPPEKAPDVFRLSVCGDVVPVAVGRGPESLGYYCGEEPLVDFEVFQGNTDSDNSQDPAPPTTGGGTPPPTTPTLPIYS
jgi:hypothetical protein